MRILSIDLGEKSLGACISDKTNTIPVPLENYFFPRDEYEEALKIVKDIFQKFPDITKILLGYPRKTSGQKAEFTFKVDKFYNLLKDQFKNDVEIILYDERFSTKRSLEIMKNYSTKDQKKLKDVLAAFLILKDYLEN